MAYAGGRLIGVAFGVALNVAAVSAATAPSENRTVPRRTNCGEYSILSKAEDRALFERKCGTLRADDYQALVDALNRLDPALEAAASRQDYRLAAYIGGGPYPPHSHQRRHLWALAGVECRRIVDADVVIWLRMSDAFSSAAQSQLQHKMLAFSAAYNSALISQPGFPRKKKCRSKVGS